jgi:hypothetical protein
MVPSGGFYCRERKKMKTCQKRKESILLRNAQARNGHVRDVFIAQK